MYQLSIEQVKKLIEIDNLLDQLEIKGKNNVAIMYSVMATLQQILLQLQKEDVAVFNNVQKEVKQ